MPVPSQILLYRITHFKNVEYILQNGICCRQHIKADPNYINIGHQQLIHDRHNYPIPLLKAGNLGEYIPFYFAGHSPMLFIIMNGYQGVEKVPQEDIAYIVTSLKKVKQAHLEFVYTNMNAKLAVAEFLQDESDFNKLHWNVIRDRYWRNTENDLTRQDYKQAEFLVRNYMPVDCILKIVVKSSSKKYYFENLIAKLALNIPIEVDVNCDLYY